MDPHQCYVEMTEAMEQADRLLAVARERAVALQAWLQQGGCYPQDHSPEVVRISMSQVLMRTDESEEV